MVAFFLTLVVSAADVPAERGAACVVRALERHADAPMAYEPNVPAHPEERAASRRAHVPASLPVSRIGFYPRLVSRAPYTPPALAPRAQAATPSSQRDPPHSLA